MRSDLRLSQRLSSRLPFVQLLAGKKLLITGVLTEASLAFAVARLALEEGAEVVLSGAGRGLSLTQRSAKRLPGSPEVLEIDVTRQETVDQATSAIAERWGELHGLLHSIAYAPEPCIGQGVLKAAWEDVSLMMNISAYSLASLAGAFRPLLKASGSGSIVGLDFDASQAWPSYDWMGVAKAALESLARYLARDLGPEGIRVNLVASGPISTMAARSIPGFAKFEQVWGERAPLGWDSRDAQAVARACVLLLSDWLPLTTGEVIHVDGGFHAVGA